eukprot:TRINITY_DN96500_c0_g1_i1.p1 TRINITY_DN96500_c0_g1~~TRINITY_DN96500_c0_g1_i1.p1  ORF type:complete len:509 (+),score=21.78 TRINITY_DN96500_c0_g1_i1:71-1597(+)
MLPYDDLLTVFSFLELSDVASVSLICKMWCRVMRVAFSRSLCFRGTVDRIMLEGHFGVYNCFVPPPENKAATRGRIPEFVTHVRRVPYFFASTRQYNFSNLDWCGETVLQAKIADPFVGFTFPWSHCFADGWLFVKNSADTEVQVLSVVTGDVAHTLTFGDVSHLHHGHHMTTFTKSQDNQHVFMTATAFHIQKNHWFWRIVVWDVSPPNTTKSTATCSTSGNRYVHDLPRCGVHKNLLVAKQPVKNNTPGNDEPTDPLIGCMFTAMFGDAKKGEAKLTVCYMLLGDTRIHSLFEVDERHSLTWDHNNKVYVVEEFENSSGTKIPYITTYTFELPLKRRRATTGLDMNGTSTMEITTAAEMVRTPVTVAKLCAVPVCHPSLPEDDSWVQELRLQFVKRSAPAVDIVLGLTSQHIILFSSCGHLLAVLTPLRSSPVPCNVSTRHSKPQLHHKKKKRKVGQQKEYVANVSVHNNKDLLLVTYHDTKTCQSPAHDSFCAHRVVVYKFVVDL